MNKLILFLAPILSLLTPYLAIAQTNANDNFYSCGYGNCPVGDADRIGYWGGMMGGNMMGWGGIPFFGWFGGIIMIIFWILVIFAIVFLIKYLVAGGDHGRRIWMEEKIKTKIKKGDSAMTILKERYAKGEIDKKELQEKMKDLKNL